MYFPHFIFPTCSLESLLGGSAVSYKHFCACCYSPTCKCIYANCIFLSFRLQWVTSASGRSQISTNTIFSLWSPQISVTIGINCPKILSQKPHLSKFHLSWPYSSPQTRRCHCLHVCQEEHHKLIRNVAGLFPRVQLLVDTDQVRVALFFMILSLCYNSLELFTFLFPLLLSFSCSWQ